MTIRQGAWKIRMFAQILKHETRIDIIWARCLVRIRSCLLFDPLICPIVWYTNMKWSVWARNKNYHLPIVWMNMFSSSVRPYLSGQASSTPFVGFFRENHQPANHGLHMLWYMRVGPVMFPQSAKSITMPGWWFGTFFIFPYIGNNNPNWLITNN